MQTKQESPLLVSILVVFIALIIVGVFFYEKKGEVLNSSTNSVVTNKDISEGDVITQEDDKEKSDLNLKNNTENSVKEADISSVISGMYLSRIELNNKKNQILDSLSKECQRYIDGIPRNMESLKTMSNLALGSEASPEFNELLVGAGNESIDEFKKIKKDIDTYVSTLEEHNKIFLTISQEIKTQYVPASDGSKYTNDFEDYFNKIEIDSDSFYNSLDLASSDYLDFKNNVSDSLSAIFMKNYNSDMKLLNEYKPITYTPSSISIPYFPTSINTYCRNFGSSISCSSSSF